MVLLDGKKLSEKILNNLKKEIKARQLKLRLAVILIGESPVSKIFIKEKEKACKKIGIDFIFFQYSENGSRDIIKKKIKKIANDPVNSGVVIQLPIPKTFNTGELLNFIPERKDVDVLSDKSFQKFSKGKLAILPPTVGAAATLLERYGIEIENKNIAVVGRGRLVGKPLAAWLKLQKVKFSIADKNTKNISSFIKKADIIISGTGQKDLIKGDMVKEGVVVIDFDHDVDFKSVSKKASYITPVPGGVGPMTVACLLENLTKLARAL